MGLPANFVALKDITIEGTAYSRGDAIDPDALPYVTLARLERRGKITRADPESPFVGNGPKLQSWVQNATSGLTVNTFGFMNVAPVLANDVWSVEYAAAMREEVEDAWGDWFDKGGGNGYEYRFSEPGIYSLTVALAAEGASGNHDKDSSIAIQMSHSLPTSQNPKVHTHSYPSADYFPNIVFDVYPFKISQSRLDFVDPDYPEDPFYTGFSPWYWYTRYTGTVTLTDVTITSTIYKWDSAVDVDTWAFGNGY